MTEYGSTSPLPIQNLALLQSWTAQTATYTAKSDPEAILRSGLVEEVAEYTYEAGTGNPANKDELAGELGDVLWYVSEIARFMDVSADEITDGVAFDDIAGRRTELTLPVTDTEGNELSLPELPQGVLAVTALRVVDVMNPKHDDLWLPDGHRLQLGPALRDLLTATSFIAAKNDIALSGAARRMIDKLASRPRQPHVIDEASSQAPVESRRERLNVHPFIGRMLVRGYISETKTGEPHELGVTFKL